MFKGKRVKGQAGNELDVVFNTDYIVSLNERFVKVDNGDKTFETYELTEDSARELNDLLFGSQTPNEPAEEEPA